MQIIKFIGMGIFTLLGFGGLCNVVGNLIGASQAPYPVDIVGSVVFSVAMSGLFSTLAYLCWKSTTKP